MIIADADDDEDQKTTMMTTTTTGRPDGCSLGLFWGPSPGRRAIIVNGFARECTIIFCLFFFCWTCSLLHDPHQVSWFSQFTDPCRASRRHRYYPSMKMTRKKNKRIKATTTTGWLVPPASRA